MPRSSSPQYSTYETKQFALNFDFLPRGDSTKDGYYLNCLVDEVGDKQAGKNSTVIIKRPGTTLKLTTSTVRFLYYWEAKEALIIVVGTTLYVYNPSTMAVTNTITSAFTTSTGEVGGTEYQYNTGEICLVISDGTKINKLSSLYVWTTSTDADIPTPHNPNVITLDGYLFTVKKDTADIYNSDIDDPLAFTSGNFITAEMAPDNLVSVVKMSNYIVALGKNSVEYFYDASGTTTPLARNETFFKNIGCIGGIAQLNNKVVFLGKELNGSVDIFLAEDSKVTPLNNVQVKRYLSRMSTYTVSSSAIVTINSNTFYLLTINGTTYCIDTDGKQASLFQYQTLNSFPCDKYTEGKSVTKLYNFIYNDSTGELVSFDYNVWEDNFNPYICRIVTPTQDYGTMQAKFVGRFSFFSDTSPDVAAPVAVSWSDNDYYSWSNPVVVFLNQELPSIRRLGSFRRRAWKFESTSNLPMRLFGYEIDMNHGSS